MACLIYEDEKSLFYTIKYLVDFFDFKPEIIITDFSLSLNKALQYKNLFETNPKIIKCFFHFSQALQKKIANLKFNKKNKLNKKLYESFTKYIQK